jgi:GAF domain-containing protein/DNA-binding CsgD family transcriptional regulator
MSEPTGTEPGRDRALVDLALTLRRLDLSSFMREVVRRTREVLGVESCKVLGFLVDEDHSLLRTNFEVQAGYALSPRIPVVVEDACQESRFGWTALLRDHGFVSGVSAVIHANGRIFGILSAYSTSRRCYTEEEADFLQSIAELLGMAAERALSEESYRYALEKERRRADAAEERYALLHEANVVLTAVPNSFAALAAAARLAVPALADWCFVDLVEEDGEPQRRVRRLVVAHPESGKAGERLARELTRHYPLDPNAPHGTPKVLRTGQPELIPEVHDELLRSLTHKGEHLELVRNLAPASYLCVPLQAGLRLVGSMGFVSSTAGRGGSVRRYGPEDLALAESLARCTALVVANILEGSPGPEHIRKFGKLANRRRSAVSSPVLDRGPGLTPRQLEVLQLLDSGMRVHQIKAELNLSEPTVRTHVRAILRAFGACSQLEALHKARTLGFVDGASKATESDWFR